MTVNITIEHNDDLLHLEVPMFWDSNERGSGWVMDFTTGDRALDDRVERAAIDAAERAERDSFDPPCD